MEQSVTLLHMNKARIFEIIRVSPAESQEALSERSERNRVTVILSMARQRMSSCLIRLNSTIVGCARANFSI